MFTLEACFNVYQSSSLFLVKHHSSPLACSVSMLSATFFFFPLSLYMKKKGLTCYFPSPTVLPSVLSSFPLHRPLGEALSVLQGPTDIHTDANDAAGRGALSPAPQPPLPPPIGFLLF